MNFSPRIITVQSAKGGVGSSIIASNLAIALKFLSKENVCLIDFDIVHGGSQASLFNIDPEVSKKNNIKNLVTNGEITPERFLENLIKHKTGIHILSSETAQDLDSISTRDVVSILSSAGNLFENIVIDLSQPYISEELITSFDFSSIICLIMTPDVITFENTQRFLELMQDLSFPSQKFQLVVNKIGISNTELDFNTIESYMGRKIYSQLPFDINRLLASINTGIPLLEELGKPSGSGFDNTSNKRLALTSMLQTDSSQLPEIAKAFYSFATNILKVAPIDLDKTIKYALENAEKFEINQVNNNSKSKSKNKADTKPVKSFEQEDYGLDKETVKEIKHVVHRKLVSEMRLDQLSQIDLKDKAKKEEIKLQIMDRISKIFDEQGIEISERNKRFALIQDITDEALGLGPLESLLDDPSVTEVMVNGVDKIYVERAGKLTLVNRSFTDERQLRVIIDRIVAPIGRRVDESSPYVDARLSDGSRVNIIIPPLAIDGASITIRKFPSKRLKIDDFIKYNTLSQEMADFLASCVLARLNIFISGGTGSGKTTLLNILSSFIPNDERIVTIEDAAELSLNQDHVVRLESKPANIEGKGAILIRDLVRNSLRMRPDRIVVGEIRGGEALDMLQAMNTGHDGSLATGHANSPRDALSRIETMVLMAGMDLPIKAIREQVASAINIIVQQSRMKDGSRKITKIVEITGMEGDIISTQEIFSFDQTGITDSGLVIGGFEHSKIRPKCLESFELRGVPIPPCFLPENVIMKMRKN